MATKTNVDLGFFLRLYLLGCEPELSTALITNNNTNNFREEEVWDYICDSPLGVIVRFVEKIFIWSSKLVEYLFVKKYEISCLFGSRLDSLCRSLKI